MYPFKGESPFISVLFIKSQGGRHAASYEAEKEIYSKVGAIQTSVFTNRTQQTTNSSNSFHMSSLTRTRSVRELVNRSERKVTFGSDLHREAGVLCWARFPEGLTMHINTGMVQSMESTQAVEVAAVYTQRGQLHTPRVAG